MEEKGTMHVHLLTELTGNLYSEESEWEEDWSESDEYGMPLDGTELADYEEVIREELERYGEDDLMQYFDGSESIQGKIQSAVVTIENKDGILYGCTKLEFLYRRVSGRGNYCTGVYYLFCLCGKPSCSRRYGAECSYNRVELCRRTGI